MIVFPGRLLFSGHTLGKRSVLSSRSLCVVFLQACKLLNISSVGRVPPFAIKQVRPLLCCFPCPVVYDLAFDYQSA